MTTSTPPPAREYVINGEAFSTLESFFDAISRNVIPGVSWGRNLDAFDDILCGGFGTPDEGFVLRWRNSALSAQRLGYAETATFFERAVANCHPENRLLMRQNWTRAIEKRGPTLFDMIVEIIRDHGPGGDQSEDGVILVLE